MNETRPRHQGAASDQATTRKRARSERVRIAVSGATAAALLSVALIGATTALGGSGGTGPGGDGDGDGGGSKTAYKYRAAWNDFRYKDKKWARQTSECESGGRARIHDSSRTYHGAFQFMKSTWRSSPMSPGGDPHRYTWKTQAVVAVKLKHRDGAGHWPVCGRKTSNLFK
jgi:hypothetical protein